MATAKVMSWNVQTFGTTKANSGTKNLPTPSELVTFLRMAINKSQADIVGISEVRSAFGDLIGNWLCAALNGGLGGAAYQWKWVASAQQDGGGREQYIVLWKDDPNVLRLDQDALPGPAWLMGVVDDHVLGPFFTSVGWTTQAQKNQAYAALAADKYIYKGKFAGNKSTKTWRVVPDQWRSLSTMIPPEVHFSGKVSTPTVLTQAERRNLGARLLAVDMLRFVTFGDRSPFVVNFVLGAAKTRFSYALAHSLEPKDPTRIPAANVPALSAALQTASATTALLLTGDFNVSVKSMDDTAKAYARIDVNGTFTFAQDPASALVKVFAPVTGPPLNAKDLIPGVLTSISKKYIADGSSEQTALANAYDKMFFHSGGPAIASIPRAINVMRWLASNQGKKVFLPAAAGSAMQALRTYKGLTPFVKDQTKLAEKFAAAKAELETAEEDYAEEEAQLTAHTPANSPIHARLNALAATMFTAQDDVKGLTDQITALGVAAGLVLNPVNTACTGIGTALAVYRRAISDHLPVIVNVTGP